jgi:hypothetical protein
VINHGRIVGDVVLGDSADTFVFGKSGALAGDLSLGGGHDLVRIENGAGKAHIADFSVDGASSDVVDVSDFFSDFSELKGHSVQCGADVFVTLDRNDQLVLENLQLKTLGAEDFLFSNTTASVASSLNQFVSAIAAFNSSAPDNSAPAPPLATEMHAQSLNSLTMPFV